jgi:hypothetical protein
MVRSNDNSAERTIGVRVSVTDFAVLVVVAVLTWWLHTCHVPGFWLSAVVVAHFFFFCNVFRVARPLELVWAGIFVVNAAFWLWHARFDWIPVTLTQAPVTVAVIAIEIVSERYHGIFARKMNALNKERIGCGQNPSD